MRVLSKYRVVIIVILGLMLGSRLIIAQDKTINMGPGYNTFTANGSGSTNVYRWLLDGVEQTEYSNKYSKDWGVGTYNLHIAAFNDSCEGDWYTISLVVDSDITILPGGQVSFNLSSADVCPIVNTKPASSEVEVLINFSGYILQAGESFAIKYIIDNNASVTTKPFSTYQASVTVNTLTLTPGEHQIKITRLMYGKDFSNQVDYSKSVNIPTMKLIVKPKIGIGEIDFK